jgi:hypothetical protein
MSLTVSASMELDQLAQHMGDLATIEQARAMRDLLVDTYLGVEVGEIPESVWLDLLNEACDIVSQEEQANDGGPTEADLRGEVRHDDQ